MRHQTLIEITRQILAETTLEGLLQRVISAACDLTDARLGISVYGYHEGVFRVGALFQPPELPHVVPGSLIKVKRGGVYLELLEKEISLRLTHAELLQHPAWWGLPEQHPPLQGLLGARLIDPDGRATGIIMVSNKEAGEFTTDDEAFLVQLAALTSLGLQHLDAYKEAERRVNELDAVFASMTDAVMVYNRGGRVVRANRAAAQTLGVDPLGMTFPELAQKIKAQAPENRRILLDNLSAERPLHGEIQIDQRGVIVNPQGRRNHLRISSAPLYYDEGTLSGAVVTWHDVTERERLLWEVEEERRRAQQHAEYLDAVFNTLTEAVSIYDTHGKLIKANPAAARAYGFDPAGIKLNDLAQQLHVRYSNSQIPPQVDLPLTRSLRGETVINERLIMTVAGGKDVVIECSTAPLYEADRIIGAVSAWHDLTERDGLLAQLERERARLRAVLQAAPEGIVETDREGAIVYTNPAAEQLYSRPIPYRQPVESHQTLHLCYPDGRPYRPEDLPLTRAAVLGESIHNLQMRIHWPDGQWRDLLVNTAPILDDQGERIGAVGVFQDISELHQIQEDLTRSLSMHQMLHQLDQSILANRPIEETAAIGLTNIRKLLPWSRCDLSVFERTPTGVAVCATYPAENAAIPTGWHGPESCAWFIPALDQSRLVLTDLADAPEDSCLAQRLRAAGICRYINIRLSADGAVLGSFNLGLDETAVLGPADLDLLYEFAAQLAIGLRQARLSEQVERYTRDLKQMVAERTAQLSASEARFRAIFEKADLGILLTDITGQRILNSNPAFQRFIGYPEKELETMDLSRLLPPEQHFLPINWQSEPSNRHAPYTQERCYYCRNGELRWANVTISVIPGTGESDEAGTAAPPFLLHLVEDITERRQIQTTLLQAEKLATAGKMAASLAHEINNPLQTVIGCLGLLEESLAQEHGAHRYLKVAGEELLRASRIVNQLRDLNRKVNLSEKKPLDLNGVLEQVLLSTQQQCNRQGVEIIWKPGTNLPTVQGVSDQLHQVFLNLVINAIEAMPEGGQLEVNSGPVEKGKRICLSFRDTGKGIPIECLPNIFNPFFTTKPNGTGLGLFVSYNIIKDHQGEIDVESLPGQGTIFRVWLPGTQPNSPKAHPRPLTPGEE